MGGRDGEAELQIKIYDRQIKRKRKNEILFHFMFLFNFLPAAFIPVDPSQAFQVPGSFFSGTSVTFMKKGFNH